MRPAESLVWAVVGASGAWLVVSVVLPAALGGLARLGHAIAPLSRPVAAVVAVVLLAGVMRSAPSSAAAPPPSERVIVERRPASGVVEVRNPVTERSIARSVDQAYTVVTGDTLWGIARTVLDRNDPGASGAKVATFWKVIYEANVGVIGADPNLILPGQVLAIPGGVHG